MVDQGPVPPQRVHPLAERALFTAVSVIVSLAITALFSLLFHAAVKPDFLVTGFVCSLVVAWMVTGQFQRMRRALAEAQERERALLVREEKMRTLRQTMRKVQHHVNNLAANLQVVELEYERSRALSPATLAALRAAIDDTATEMRALGQVEDPFDSRPFEVRA